MKNFSIKAKLLMLSAFLVSVSIVLGAVSYWSMNKVIKDFTVVSDVSYPNTSLMLEMYSNYRSARLQAMIMNSSIDAEGKAAAVKTFNGNVLSDAEFHKKYMEVDYLPGEEPLYLSFRGAIDTGYGYVKEAMKLMESGKKDPETLAKIDELINVKLGGHSKTTRETSAKLKDFHMNQARAAADNAKASGANATKIIAILIIVMGSIGFAAAYFFSNALVATLRQISEALDESSAQVSSAAGQIASSSEELSQAATEQASSLEETSSSVEEMSSMVNINTENAKNASENSEISKRQAERGRTVVTEMVQSMSQINESNNKIMTQINHSNDQMSEIVKVIQEIETKTKVINDIVFQTKLLSFNASVEAARAGEQGKGFAVVAEEVGNLAQMSGNAAKEISEMLASSIHKVEAIVNDTKSKVDVLIAEGKEKVAAGTKVAEECGEVLSEIVINVTSVATMASEISNASFEQSKGIQEITKAMGLLDQVTQTNAATSEEAASSAEQLSSQATSMKNQVLLLVATINGTTPPTEDSFERSTPTKPTMNKTPPTAKVMPFKAPAKKAAPAAKVTHSKHDVAPIKKAAGGALPSYDHPGFEEV
jgi:methyl-accepting chemotaxis protein